MEIFIIVFVMVLLMTRNFLVALILAPFVAVGIISLLVLFVTSGPIP